MKRNIWTESSIGKGSSLTLFAESGEGFERHDKRRER